MKKKLFLGAVLLLSANLLFFSSCEKDDTPSVPTVKITELGSGHDSPNDKIAYAGSDAHIEAEITAEGLIESISVEVHQEGGSFKFNEVFTDAKGLKNHQLHKHLDIPAEAPAGEYHLHLVVKDQHGQTATAESHLTIKEAPVNITISGLIFGAGHTFPDNLIGYVGTAPVVEASSITAENGISQIVVSMHSEEPGVDYKLDFEFPLEGEIELKDFHQHIAIPADAPAGDYHLHFKVIDKKEQYKEESLDIQIKEPGIKVTGLEIGSNNTAPANNVHTEFSITGDTGLKSIRVRVYKEATPGEIVWQENYTENFGNEEVKQYTFHKHLNMSGKVEVGDYIMEIRVNDKKDASVTIKEAFTIKE